VTPGMSYHIELETSAHKNRVLGRVCWAVLILGRCLHHPQGEDEALSVAWPARQKVSNAIQVALPLQRPHA
jgi:hypothetical protein